jgi:hypothetical protein
MGHRAVPSDELRKRREHLHKGGVEAEEKKDSGSPLLRAMMILG